jgi:hypothetical protein
MHGLFLLAGIGFRHFYYPTIECNRPTSFYFLPDTNDLSSINKIGLLKKLFHEVFMPDAVKQEIISDTEKALWLKGVKYEKVELASDILFHFSFLP